MNILLTGAGGQLGRELRPLLAELGTVTAVDRSAAGLEGVRELDLADADRLDRLLQEVRPGLVVNAAAYTAVDRAEREADAAFAINAGLPGRLAGWSNDHGAFLLHYSTDYVFSGEADRPYREDDPTGPINVYGESKLAGERAVADSGCAHAQLRTSWVYASHGQNFVRTMLRLAGERDTLRVVDDQFGRPTWARSLAQASMQLLAGRVGDGTVPSLHGTWHYCDSGALSWYDFARSIFRLAAELDLVERVPEIVPVSSDAFPQVAERPQYSVLDTSRIGEDFGIEPPGVETSLRACLQQMKKAQ